MSKRLVVGTKVRKPTTKNPQMKTELFDEEELKKTLNKKELENFEKEEDD